MAAYVYLTPTGSGTMSDLSNTVGKVIYVSHSFACPTETRYLGEAYPVVKIADDAMREFRKCIELIRSSSHDGLRKCAEELDSVLSDVLHDASWAYWVEESRDAFNEAKVSPVRGKS